MFVFIVLTVLAGIPFVFVLSRLLWIIYNQVSFFRRSVPRLATILLLAALTGCNNTLGTPLHRSSASQRKAPSMFLAHHKLSPTPTALKSTDWPTYHHDNARTGYVPNEPDPKHLVHAWTVKLRNAVYAEPLVIGERVIVATEGDVIYSLDANTGQIQWHSRIGYPVPLSALNCGGNIDLIGITGTPVYDPVSGLAFAVAEVTGPFHLLVGVDINTGKVRIRRQVDVPEMSPPRIYLQRPALALSHGMVYIAFGGLVDDCGTYHGTIVASRTDGEGPLLSYQVPTQDAGGIWGPSGPAIDKEGQVYVATGNEDHMGSGNWDLSNAVLRLSPTLQLEDRFAPAEWRMQDTGNQDLGSMGPALLPGDLVFIAGKSGLGYLLHSNALGGIGGQVAVVRICNGLAQGGVALVGSQVFVPCTDGLRHVLDPEGTRLMVDWHAAEQINLPPIVGGYTLYSLDPGGNLYALDIDTGQMRAKIVLGDAVPHFATPTISRGRIFVGTYTGVSAVAIE